MEAIHSEMIKHMLEAADAHKYSVLFDQPQHWDEFSSWCQESNEASRVISGSSDHIDTVCIDENEKVYCVAMSVETLEQVVRDLVEAYEDNVLEHLFARSH